MTTSTTKKRKMSTGDSDSAVASPSAAAADAATATAASSSHTTAAVTVPPSSPPPAATGPAPTSAITSTFHRRVLPQECIAFSSAEGRKIFTDAITDSDIDGATSNNYMQIYFPLAEQFTTQAEPAFCGLATLAMCLNALHIDPGRIWKGPWRWFSEELLDCCTPLATAKEQGISFEQFVCLARCNGALAHGVRADSALSLAQFRALVMRSCATSDEIVVLNYTRKALEQTGDGHFSPIGGYSAARDMVLLLDVARFKYPPHWVRLPLVFEALQRVDASSGRARGLVVLSENKDMTGPTPATRVMQARAAAGAVDATVTIESRACCGSSMSGCAPVTSDSTR